MKMKKIFTLALPIMAAAMAFAQNPYAVTCAGAGELESGGDSRSVTPRDACATCARTGVEAYSDNFYIPTASTNIKEVQINLIFLRKNDGTAGFDPVADDKFWDDVEGFVNWKVQALSTSATAANGTDCYSSTSQTDSKIRYKFTRHTVNNTTYWENYNGGSNNVTSIYGCPQFSNFYLNPLDLSLRSTAGFPNGINCYFTVYGNNYAETISNSLPHANPTVGWACSITSSCDVDNDRLMVHFPGVYNGHIEPKGPTLAAFPGTFYDPTSTSYNSSNIYWWEVDELAGGIIHELGHCLFDEVHHRNSCPDHWMRQGNPRSYMTPLDLGEAHRNLTVGTISKYVNNCDPLTTDYVVSANKTIDYDWRSYQNIVIEPNCTLTVTCRIRMPNNGTITVKQNAKLIIDGGTLTSACDGMWGGVKVWGNAAQHQSSYGTNQYYQGLVVMKNGALIENAATGVSLGKPGDWQMYYTGGIIYTSTNSVFRNNSRDVEFLKYQNFNPSNPSLKLGNVSNFRNTTFETSAKLNNGSNPSNHVTMWNVDGVRFYGCTFENRYAAAPSNAALGNGIYAEDANFIVTGCDWTVACAPGLCCNYSTNTFKNLNIGINSKRVSSTLYNYNVDKNTFINCVTGVQNDAVDNAVITRNNFTLGKLKFAAFFGVGVNFNAGSGYRVEENVMTRDASPNTPILIGSWMTNTGMVNNQVYKNTYTNLYTGSYGYLRNQGLGTGGIRHGLAFLCNTHSGTTTYDQYTYGNDPILDGIRQYQGKLNTTETDATNSAGNVFCRSGVNAESDFANPNTPNITYFYDGPTTGSKYPLYVTTSRVTRTTAAANGCPTSFPIGGGSGKTESASIALYNGNVDASTKESLLEKYSLLTSLLENSVSAYRLLIDGGNSSQLQSSVQSTVSGDVWALRQKLLDVSPFLSKETLKQTIQGSNLPDGIIAEILRANPELAKDADIQEKLAEQSFPEWMATILSDETRDIVSSRTSIEAGIANLSAERDQVITAIVHDIISKRNEGAPSNGEIRTWLANYKSASGDYQLADDMLESKEYDNALAIIASIPSVYNLNAKERAEYDGFKRLFSVLVQVSREGRNYYQLTESEKAAISEIADGGEGLSRVRACNLISFVSGTECDFKMEVPGGTKSFAAKKETPEVTPSEQRELKLFPNPAKEYLEIRYDLLLTGNRSVEIVDLNGTVVSSFSIADSKGEKTADIRSLSSGNYFCRIVENGKTILQNKFVVIK